MSQGHSNLTQGKIIAEEAAKQAHAHSTAVTSHKTGALIRNSRSLK